MKIEIWSDLMCPFCYIGKRKFEKALSKFQKQEDIQVIWKSFLLQPDIKFQPGKSIYEFLSESKGMSLSQAKSMTQQVAQMAAQEGLNFNFDKIVVSNSFNAHQLIHLAASQGLQDLAAERLFSAYFVEGKNVEDHQVLIEAGIEIGLEKVLIQKMLKENEFSKQVKSDVSEARELGLQGVPFFVFNRKYGVSGAQPTNVFLEMLQKLSHEEVL